ncbi:MAG TPA: hypothetical protein V6C58_16690, partial [Allocoleopsis sp.]
IYRSGYVVVGIMGKTLTEPRAVGWLGQYHFLLSPTRQYTSAWLADFGELPKNLNGIETRQYKTVEECLIHNPPQWDKKGYLTFTGKDVKIFASMEEVVKEWRGE